MQIPNVFGFDMNVYQSTMPALENFLPIHIGIAICNPHTENWSHFRLLDKDPFLCSISRAFFSTLIHEDIHPKVHSSCLTGGFSWQLWAWLGFYTNTSIPAPLQASLQNMPVIQQIQNSLNSLIYSTGFPWGKLFLEMIFTLLLNPMHWDQKRHYGQGLVWLQQ